MTPRPSIGGTRLARSFLVGVSGPHHEIRDHSGTIERYDGVAGPDERHIAANGGQAVDSVVQQPTQGLQDLIAVAVRGGVATYGASP